MSNPEMRRPGAATPGHQNAAARQGIRVCADDNEIAPDDQMQLRPRRLWHAFATHGGGRCSHYVGDFRTALFESLQYARDHGGRLHLEVC